MVKALFTFDYDEEYIKKIENLGYETVYIKERNAVYEDCLQDVEVLVCYNPFSKLDISRFKNLKWIQLTSVGIDQIPKDMVEKNNIIVTNNKGGYKIPVSEWIVMDILNLMKNSMKFYLNQREKIWKWNTKIFELYGKTVCLIGTGTIAVEAAKRLKGFGVNIIGVNTKGTSVEHFDQCIAISKLDEALALSDIVVLTLPYTSATHNLIDESKFAAMKDGVFFVNTARGAIVNEADLIKNLQSGKIAGAALDVFVEEPLPQDSPLWTMDNVIITPHNSWASEAGDKRRQELIYENLKRYVNEEPLLNVVNLSKGY